MKYFCLKIKNFSSIISAIVFFIFFSFVAKSQTNNDSLVSTINKLIKSNDSLLKKTNTLITRTDSITKNNYVLLKNYDSLVKKNIPEPAIPQKKWNFDLQLDQRTSYYNSTTSEFSSSAVSIIGLSLGWTHKGRFRIGAGGYFSNVGGKKTILYKYNPIIQQQAPNAQIYTLSQGKVYLVNYNMQLYYITPSFEYAYYKSKWLDLSIPLEIGVGYSKLLLTDNTSGENIPLITKSGQLGKSDSYLIPSQIGAAMMINLSKDVGLSAAFGYRYVLYESAANLGDDFNAFYWQAGLQLFPGNIKSDLKRDFDKWKAKKKLRKEEKLAKKIKS